MFTLFFMFSSYAQPKHGIQKMDKAPTWGEQLRTINLGKYYDVLTKEKTKDEILALHSSGDRTIGIITRFKNFYF
jgi:hypothetical protein